MSETKIDFMKEAKQSLKQLPLTDSSLDPDLKKIDVEGGTIDLELFTCEKIEKVVLSAIKIHESGVSDETVIIWPDNAYNFPALWFTLTVIPSVMNVPIIDFVPMMDFVVWPAYAEKYVQGVKDLRLKALEIFGETVLDKAIDLPSLSVYTFSPYHLVAKISDEGISRLPEVMNEYMKAYIELWRQAEQVTEKPEQDFYLKKKEATRLLMKGNDPGFSIMASIFGQERTRKVFDLVF
jgi:hypothetical protein